MFLAQEGGGDGGGLTLLLMFVAIIAIFYFLMIRPQRRRQQQARQMQAELAEGDQVVTVGGLHGTVAELDEGTVILETAEGVFSRYERSAVGRVVTRAGEDGEPGAEADSDPVAESNPVIEQRDKD